MIYNEITVRRRNYSILDFQKLFSRLLIDNDYYIKDSSSYGSKDSLTILYGIGKNDKEGKELLRFIFKKVNENGIVTFVTNEKDIIGMIGDYFYPDSKTKREEN